VVNSKRDRKKPDRYGEWVYPKLRK
jgi:hypothetical protein